MPERNLTVVQDEPKEVALARERGQTLSDDLRDMIQAKPSVATMRASAKVLTATKEFIEFIHGALDPGIAQAYEVWKKRTALRSTLLRIPLDRAKGAPQSHLTEAGKIEAQLLLIPNSAYSNSKRVIDEKAAAERRALEAAQRAIQEAERAAEVKELVEQGQVEIAEDLKAAPLPPVILPTKEASTPVVEGLASKDRYKVEGIEVTDHRAFNKWLSEQAADLNDKLSEVKKGGIAAYLNATAGAEIPGIRAQKSDVVTDRRK